MPKYRILVVDTPNCIKLLEYLDENIEFIVRADGYIDIIKVDLAALSEEKSAELKKKGITSMPVLIDPNNKIITGVARITHLFDKRYMARQVGSERPITHDMGGNPGLAEFYAQEMFEVKNGVLEKREDGDGEDTAGEGDNSLEAKIRAYQQPKHRQLKPTAGKLAEYEQNARMQAHQDEPQPQYTPPDDNIGPPDDLADRYGVPKHKQTSADDKMITALLNRLDH